MSHSEEISRRHSVAVSAVKDLLQMLTIKDGEWEAKVSQLKVLEERKEKLLTEISENQRKASDILSKASDDASRVRKEATQLMNEAETRSENAKSEAEEARKLMGEAKSLMAQAVKRQAEADQQYRILEERKNKIEAALR